MNNTNSSNIDDRNADEGRFAAWCPYKRRRVLVCTGLVIGIVIIIGVIIGVSLRSSSNHKQSPYLLSKGQIVYLMRHAEPVGFLTSIYKLSERSRYS